LPTNQSTAKNDAIFMPRDANCGESAADLQLPVSQAEPYSNDVMRASIIEGREHSVRRRDLRICEYTAKAIYGDALVHPWWEKEPEMI
jgi:hypothetical protein